MENCRVNYIYICTLLKIYKPRLLLFLLTYLVTHQTMQFLGIFSETYYSYIMDLIR